MLKPYVRFLVLAAVAAVGWCGALAPGVASAAGKFQLEEATIDDIQGAIQSGEITCKGLVQAYMKRVKAYNGVCAALVTAEGQSVPAATGTIRAGAPLKFPTQTVALRKFVPDFEQYAGL